MNIHTTMRQRQIGAANKWALGIIALAVLAGVWFASGGGGDIKKSAQLKTMEMVGDLATERLAAAGGEGVETHGSAVDLIKRPIEVRQVTDRVYYATGVGNTVMITTDAGNVVFDTGLVLQSAKQLRLLKEQVSDAPVHSIILSHSHADHIGGAKLWREEGTEIVAHKEYEEEQRYLSELEPYLYSRNRTLFPWMPAERTDVEMMRYGGIEPTITVGNWETYRFTLGGVDFEVIGTPGAEGADNVVLWLPQEKVLITGDFYGPQFPQFPNVFTMRGEKVRKPTEYISSLDLLIPLGAEIVVPSHLDPTEGAEVIRAGMQRIRDAVQYVHDEVVAGMNAGNTVYDLMKSVELPAELDLVQNHGKVDWAVKSIWEYYATWFHFDSTTELYPVPARDVYSDLAQAAGPEALLSLGQNYLQQDAPVKVLHIMEILLAGEPGNREGLGLRKQALERLKEKAEAGARNDYEIFWLKSRLAATEQALAGQG